MADYSHFLSRNLKVRQPAWEPLNKPRTNMSVTLPTLLKIVCSWRTVCTLYYTVYLNWCDWPHLQFSKHQFMASSWLFVAYSRDFEFESIACTTCRLSWSTNPQSINTWSMDLELIDPQSTSPFLYFHLKTSVTVPYRLFRCIFDCIAVFKALYCWTSVKGEGHTCLVDAWISNEVYQACNSHVLNESSVIPQFEHSNVIKTRGGIIFDFYTRLPHLNSLYCHVSLE